MPEQIPSLKHVKSMNSLALDLKEGMECMIHYIKNAFAQSGFYVTFSPQGFLRVKCAQDQMKADRYNYAFLHSL